MTRSEYDFDDSRAALNEAYRFIDALINDYEVIALGPESYKCKKEPQLGSRADIEQRLIDHIHFTGRISRQTPKGLWESLLTTRLNSLLTEAKQQLANKLAYNKAAAMLDPVAEVTEIITGERNPVDIAVLKQFLWQVKRKMNGLPVTWHIMPIIWGKGGSGKSYIIRDVLLKPLEGFTLASPALLITLTDERKFHNFADNLVAMADEMAHIEKTNVESLKTIITETEVKGRKLYTNSSIAYKQNCTFIGTSNNSPSQLIYDPTGIRRFHYIKSVDAMDHSRVAKLDPIIIWQSIDELQDEAYTLPVMSELNLVQEKFRQKDTVESFLTDNNIEPSETNMVEVRKLFTEYKKYCEESGYKFSVTKQALKNQLIEKFNFKEVPKELGSKYRDVPHLYASMKLTNLINGKGLK